MRLLLDTHALLWWLGNMELDDRTRTQIQDPAGLVAVSAASVWETAIKVASGKLHGPEPLTTALGREGFEALAITAEHAERAGSLPLHHRDPFDRMLVAQAQLEGLTVVTRDRAFDAYEVPLLRC